jgi:hypothetical protein
MSSVLAYTATVTPRRIAFLRAEAATATWTVNSGATVEQVMTTTAFAANTTLVAAAAPSDITSGSVLRDMGNEIRTVDANGFHTASFRRVQIQRGEGAEGVGGTFADGYLTYYVCVWSANQSLATEAHPAVTVSRLG